MRRSVGEAMRRLRRAHRIRESVAAGNDDGASAAMVRDEREPARERTAFAKAAAEHDRRARTLQTLAALGKAPPLLRRSGRQSLVGCRPMKIVAEGPAR